MQVLRRDLPARCVKSVLPIDFVPKPSPQLWISFVQRTISNVTVRRNPQNQASLTDANRSTKDEPCSAYSSLDHLHRLQSVNNSVMPTQLSGSRFEPFFPFQKSSNFCSFCWFLQISCPGVFNLVKSLPFAVLYKFS